MSHMIQGQIGSPSKVARARTVRVTLTTRASPKAIRAESPLKTLKEPMVQPILRVMSSWTQSALIRIAAPVSKTLSFSSPSIRRDYLSQTMEYLV